MNRNNRVVTGLSLYMSNNMETLGDICALMMSEYPLADPLAHEKIVVMNLGMETFLSQRIAMQNNIVSLCDYRQVWQIIYDTHRLLHPSAPKQDLYDRDHMTWNIFSQIKLWSEQSLDSSKQINIYERLQQYLEDDTFGDKAYELSAKIADTLDQYQMYRPRWILAWNKIPLSAFDDYELAPDNKGNPINVFIEEECKRFVIEKSGFNEAKKRASHKDEDGVNLIDEVDSFAQGVSKGRVDLIRDLFEKNVWQIKLWCMLRYNLNLLSSDDIGFNDQSSPEFVWLLEHLDRSQVMSSLITELKSDKELPQIFDRIFVFGVSSLPRVVIEFLDALATRCSVNVMLLNPCSEYWADIAPRHRNDFKQYVKLIQGSTKSIHDVKLSTKKKYLQVSAQNLSINDYDDAGERVEGNPLLLSYGQQGRDNLYMFFDRDPVPDNISCFSDPDVEIEFESSFEDINGQYLETVQGGSLLAFLQKQLLNLEQHKCRYIIGKDDRSFSIHSCHTKRREVEILHDAILERFNQAKIKGEKLYPRDFVVMVPTINDYAPHISAVFGGAKKHGSADSIPYVISDRTETEANPICQALLMLLEIGTKRITSSLVINLLSESAISSHFNISQDEVPVIASWLKDSNIYWGLDDEDTGEVAEINIPGTFAKGMDRMVLGSMLGDSDTMPCFSEIEGFDAKTLGNFWDFLQALRDLRDEFTPELSLSPSGWAERLSQKLTYRFFDNNFDTDNALSVVYQIIENLKTIFGHIEHKPSINLPVFAATLRQGLTSQRNYQPFLKDKVNFCSLVPMRAVPFKHVFILGLNDVDFPREELSPGFNLMSCRDLFERGDRSRGIDDRYLFLEAILSARSSLYLSYIGQSPIDKTTLNPSIVLDDLIYYLTDCCTVEGHEHDQQSANQQAVLKRILAKEYLNGYNVSNYVVNNNEQRSDVMPSVPSFKKSYILLDNSVKRASNVLGTGVFYEDFSNNLKHDLTLSKLFSFISNPDRDFLNDVLKINLRITENAQLQEDEQFNLDGFQVNKHINNLINLMPHERPNYIEHLSLLGSLPYGIFKNNLIESIDNKSENLLATLKSEFNLDSYSQVSVLDCNIKTYKVYIPKSYFKEQTGFDVLELACKNMNQSIEDSEDNYCFEVGLQGQASSRTLMVNCFRKLSSSGVRSPVLNSSGTKLEGVNGCHMGNNAMVFGALKEAIGQYLYDGGLKTISIVDINGSLGHLDAFTKDEIEVVIYALLIYYLLGRGAPMPINSKVLTNLSFDEMGCLTCVDESKKEDLSEEAIFLYASLDSILQNERLNRIASGFYDFYISLIAPKFAIDNVIKP